MEAILIALGIAALGFVVVFVIFIWRAYRGGWEWTGFAGSQSRKTLWDWLDLLLVPVGIVIVGSVFGIVQNVRNEQREDKRDARERSIAADRSRAEVLRAYLQQMSELTLQRGLNRSRPTPGVKELATTLTLTALRQLDGRRKGTILQFLSQARLVDPATRKVNLLFADLRGVILHNGYLPSLDLRGVHVEGANFDQTGIGSQAGHSSTATFEGAYLRGASLRHGRISNADFREADLRNADFTDSDIWRARFDWACVSATTFFTADVQRSSFFAAKGADVDFSRASLYRVNFAASPAYVRGQRRAERQMSRRFGQPFPVPIPPTRMTDVNFTGARREKTSVPKNWHSDGLPMTKAARQKLLRRCEP
jgi:uncharacterized protein YjbI with pentapeptide repeats